MVSKADEIVLPSFRFTGIAWQNLENTSINIRMYLFPPLNLDKLDISAKSQLAMMPGLGDTTFRRKIFFTRNFMYGIRSLFL